MNYYSVPIDESSFKNNPANNSHADNNGHEESAAVAAPSALTVPRGIFRNRDYFPNYRDLSPGISVYHDLDLRYCHVLPDGRVSAAKTWCLMGEIVDDSLAAFGLHTIRVKDWSGYHFIIHFYTSDTEAVFPMAFQYSKPATGYWKLLRNGSTICIRYAESHRFLDGSEGIRVGCYNNVKILKHSLDDLLTLSDDQPEVRIKTTMKSCWNCDKPAKANCGRCNFAYYCNKECQNNHWNRQHKKFCKSLVDYMDLVDIDFAQPINPSRGINLKLFQTPCNTQA